jgi:hypothetical protein
MNFGGVKYLEYKISKKVLGDSRSFMSEKHIIRRRSHPQNKIKIPGEKICDGGALLLQPENK